ncbi:MAG: fibronectin type III domain-containing protein [Saccharospirillum sp.]
MKTLTSILTIMVAMALAGCQVTVDDERVSGALGSGSSSEVSLTEQKAKPGEGAGETVVADAGAAEPEAEAEPVEEDPIEAVEPEPEPEPQARSVTLYWNAPMERVNGDVLEQTEIAGYEIRYRKADDTEYTKVVVDGSAVNSYYIDDLSMDEYVFELAVFDNSGLYSDFVVAQ